jgi:zinc/manganese transport system substrate-binding protein
MRVWDCVVAVGLLMTGCATGKPQTAVTSSNVQVVAAESFWGSIAAELGGSHVLVQSLVDNPNADPHDYEPLPRDARLVAGAQLAIVNGVGYDTWMTKLLAAPGTARRTVLTVGDVAGVKPGGNPHRWYSPRDVRAVADAITAAYKRLDPADAAYFETQHDTVVKATLGPYFDLVAQLKARYGGTPIGASESIVAPLADALGLRLLTPASFVNAISEGGEPTAADKATVDRQIAEKQIAVYVYNSQNATPDVRAQVRAARAKGIPVVTVTETMVPANTSFETWQVGQLTALRDALAKATGR